MRRGKCIIRLIVIAAMAWCLVLNPIPSLNAQEQPAKTSESAKALIVKVNAGNNFGAGIIFNVRGGYLFIITAFHVVKASATDAIQVEFEFLRDIPVTAELRDTNANLDLAVLRVDIYNSRLRGINLDQIPFELLNENLFVEKQTEVFPVGHPEGDEWYVPLTAAKVRKVIFEAEIQFEFSCAPGYSGGGLFSRDWQLLGMILRDHGRYCEAISLKRICATLEDAWELEVSRERIRAVPVELPTPTPSSSAITQQNIAQLLKTADAYFTRQWYTTPPKTNAFDIYLEVLRLDPLNAHALQKIDQIAQFYKSRAEQELKRGRQQQALENYQKYLTIMPNDEEVLDKIAELMAPPTPVPTATTTSIPTATPELAPTATPTSATKPTTGQERHDSVSGIDFMWIQEGCFQMGQTEADERYLLQEWGEEDYKKYFLNELPQHQVCLDGFWMGKTEVTQAQWKKIMGNNISSFQGETRPVEYVSWNDVQEFLRKLNEQAGKAMYRLPSEAEWEYAARADTQTSYSFGDDDSKLGEYAWYFDNSGGSTHSVGQLKPNAWGLYDMHGNVWEWCQDWYDSEYYSKSPSMNPQGPPSGGYRVVRGGSWYASPRYSRLASRVRHSPGSRYYDVGFRVVVGSGAWTLQ